jgi:hypothetical protein
LTYIAGLVLLHRRHHPNAIQGSFNPKTNPKAHLQECAARGINGRINLRHHLSADVPLHLQLVSHAAICLDLVCHVNERLAQVDANHLLEHARHLKG